MDAVKKWNRNFVGGAKGRNDGRRIRRACDGLMYQRVRVLDVAREPRDKVEAQAVLNADEATVVDVPSREESLDEVVGLLDFSVQLSNFLMRVPELTF